VMSTGHPTPSGGQDFNFSKNLKADSRRFCTRDQDNFETFSFVWHTVKLLGSCQLGSASCGKVSMLFLLETRAFICAAVVDINLIISE